MTCGDVETAEGLAGPTTSRDAAPGRLQRRVGDLPPAFWWLWLGTLVNRAGTFIQPFVILYLTGPRHLSVPAAGTVVTVWGVGSLLSQPIGGYLTDRIGRRWTLSGGMFAVAIALGVLAMARDIPSITATVADLLDGRQRIRAYALQ
ncbi:MAG: MFS transporter, partial [Actinomycetota bacterium]